MQVQVLPLPILLGLNHGKNIMEITKQDYFRYEQCQFDSCTACCDYIRAICRRITEMKREEKLSQRIMEERKYGNKK